MEIYDQKHEEKVQLLIFRILGLTSDTFLKFKINSDSIYCLEFVCPLSSLKDLKAIVGKGKNKKFELNITYPEDEKDKIMYLGGDSTHLDPILLLINPIQMIEKKIEAIEKSGCSDYDSAIEQYSTLIEHYSQTDSQKTAKLIKSMKKIIELRYEQP